ncbi:hypothetical protein RFI_06776, partial [Reticulomyxa filosa]
KIFFFFFFFFFFLQNRFPNPLHNDLRKMAINLTPFPRLHFFLMSQSPIFAHGQGTKLHLTYEELTDQMWSSRNFMTNIYPGDGKYLSVALLYRGNDLKRSFTYPYLNVSEKLSEDCVSWIPNNIKSAIISIPPEITPASGTFIANSTAIKGLFQRISGAFARLFKRKAFLHWYKSEGMDEYEFMESDQHVRELISSYQDKQDAVADFLD